MCERHAVSWLAVALVAVLVVLAAAAAPMAHVSPRVQIWSDRGQGGVYRIGECAQIAFRPEADCYVMIYGIDTDGYLRLLFPRECDDQGYVLGGRTYSIWRDGFYKFYVNGPTGMEYVHVLASYEPFRQVYWQGCGGYDHYAMEATWRGFHDYWGCALPPRVYGDPYAAMQMIDEFICLDALEAGGVWADFTYFYVGDRVRYPRYLCYDCHGFNARFSPYSDVCVAFTVSFVDCDPCYSPWSWWWWCSPRRAYCGPRYICHGRDGWCEDRGHGHGGGHGDNHGHSDHATYPSEYKWKSRGEGSGLAVPAVLRTPVTKHGNTTEVVKVKATASERDAGRVERPERAERSSREVVARDAVRHEASEGETRQTKSRDVEVKAHKATTERSHEKASNNEKAVRSDKAKGRSLLGTIAKHVLRSDGSSSKDKPKGTSPQVRNGDKGKSPVTRRKVSR